MIPMMDERRILIIEDDLNTSAVLVRILVKAGYVADCTHSAEQAISLISENDYHLLIIDMVLPGMDGVALLKKVKKNQSGYPDGDCNGIWFYQFGRKRAKGRGK